MTAPASRLRQIGWIAVLSLCTGLFAVLSVQAQSVHSAVSLAERQIIALERETAMLETEFQARANQRQLADWNSVEFGYEAPRADQYIDSERQLASLGLPELPGAPDPIRIARADVVEAADRQRPMVSPLSGEPVTFASARRASDAGAVFTDAFGEFLIDASPLRSGEALALSTEATR
ncbi:MAG: hypothetical protein WA918_07230 [Erythrobacter sp.]